MPKNLITLARALPPDERVPYAFEKRIMHRLRSAPALDLWGLWSRGLWRAAGPCVAVMLLAGAWAVFSPDAATLAEVDLEGAIMAPAELAGEAW